MDWEFLLLDFIQKYLKSDFMDTAMKTVSLLGKLCLLWILLAVVTTCIKKTRRFGLTLASDIALNLLAGNLIIKPIVCRPRPCWLNRTVEMITSVPTDYSFPSGHTMFAFGAATIIFCYHKGWGIAAYVFAALMGLSRMYLYVHFPTDVLFGAVFGILIAILTYYLFNLLFPKRRLRLITPSEA